MSFVLGKCLLRNFLKYMYIQYVFIPSCCDCSWRLLGCVVVLEIRAQILGKVLEFYHDTIRWHSLTSKTQEPLMTLCHLWRLSNKGGGVGDYTVPLFVYTRKNECHSVEISQRGHQRTSSSSELTFEAQIHLNYPSTCFNGNAMCQAILDPISQRYCRHGNAYALMGDSQGGCTLWWW